MNIPFLDLKSQYNQIKEEVTCVFKNLLDRQDFILGRDVAEFEDYFARYIGSKYALGVNSGTDALFLGLLALGVACGDEVIVPDYTYIASAFAVSYIGAKPVFVDIEEKTFNIDPEKIERAITNKTKAIMPVHLYGQTARMDKIKEIARHHGLKIIEDAAQAHGAELKGKKAGSFGDAGAFSFYPTKNLGAFGDAGLIVTDNAVIFKRLKRLRDYGRKSRYVHISLGYNSRLDSIQALYLKAKLKYLDEWNEKRVKIADFYRQQLLCISGLELYKECLSCKHVYHIFACLTKKRDFVVERLNRAGVHAAVHYPVPLHRQPVYKHLGYKKNAFPVSSDVAKKVFCLPIYPHMTQAQAEYVVNSIKKVMGEI